MKPVSIPDPQTSQALAGMPSVEAVRELEALLMQCPQVSLGTTHVLHGGMCARTIMIPAGTVLTGAQTKIPNICLVAGDITVTTDAGPQRLTGYHVLPAVAGFKRVGFAHTDTYWTTVWITNKTEIEAIEDEMTDEAAQLQTRRPGIEYAKPGLIGGAL